MSVGGLGVLLARAALAGCAALALPWLHGEVNYVSLEPSADGGALSLPRVAHARARSESRAHGYVQAVRRQMSVSSALFSLAFEESAMLFVLVLLEHAHGDVPWVRAHWRVSLPMVLLLIVLGLRFFEVVLARAGVLGITLIAALSGSAAGGAMCDSYETIAIRRQRRWRESDVQTAQASFERACMDLHTARTAAVELSEEIARGPKRSAWAFWSRNAKDRELAELQTEIIGLEAMANTMRTDLEVITEHERRVRYQRTVLGRVLLLSSHVFSVYCTFRIAQCVLNLVVFGYRGTSPDFVSTCVAHAMRMLGLDVDVALWAPRIGFLSVGILIVLRMRVLLSTLSTLIRSVSAGVSAQLLVLFTAEVLCIYTLAALIQLHASVSGPRASKSALLATLPEFQRVFGALFDCVFLVAALLTGAYRWFQWQSDAFAAFDS
ncbi:hypothetical protein MBRA1_002151 [Malassezia brasiliensis]|uniref:Abscisic acid G-protein coupled receptor-like domain-containing protein n=1 Tax=Malassezia brasiliensis TaxID=1821822 RepID=A0AAF0DT04_9BASI|nr:hypothetical protein MBRA1_002151 [Malassezia brasiliensis]